MLCHSLEPRFDEIEAESRHWVGDRQCRPGAAPFRGAAFVPRLSASRASRDRTIEERAAADGGAQGARPAPGYQGGAIKTAVSTARIGSSTSVDQPR